MTLPYEKLQGCEIIDISKASRCKILSWSSSLPILNLEYIDINRQRLQWPLLSLTVRIIFFFSLNMESFRLQDIPVLWNVAVRGCWCTEKDQQHGLTRRVWVLSLYFLVSIYFPSIDIAYRRELLSSVDSASLGSGWSECWVSWEHSVCYRSLGEFSHHDLVAPDRIREATCRWLRWVVAELSWEDGFLNWWNDYVCPQYIPPQSWIVDRSLSSAFKGPNVDSLPQPGARI